MPIAELAEQDADEQRVLPVPERQSVAAPATTRIRLKIVKTLARTMLAYDRLDDGSYGVRADSRRAASASLRPAPVPRSRLSGDCGALVHDEHRPIGVVQDALRDAADDRRGDRAETARADDDQVDVACACQAEDLVSRVALDEVVVRADPARLRLRDRLLQRRP